MAFVPAPGVAQFRLVGTVGGNPWAVVLHMFNNTSNTWTQPAITALANTAQSSAVTNLIPRWTGQVIVNYADAVDLSDQTLRYAKTTANPATGTGIGSMPTLGTCLMINHRALQRYRGGHGRTYFPGGPVADSVNSDTWSASAVNTWTTAFNNWRDAIYAALTSAGVSSASICIPRYSYTYTNDSNHHKWTKEKSAFITAGVVNTSVVNNQIRSQRRRLGP